MSYFLCFPIIPPVPQRSVGLVSLHSHVGPSPSSASYNFNVFTFPSTSLPFLHSSSLYRLYCCIYPSRFPSLPVSLLSLLSQLHPSLSSTLHHFVAFTLLSTSLPFLHFLLLHCRYFYTQRPKPCGISILFSVDRTIQSLHVHHGKRCDDCFFLLFLRHLVVLCSSLRDLYRGLRGVEERG